MRPLVTIVTATRDRPAELRRAHASVRAQTYENWEWVVVDDHSREDYARRLASEDARIRYLQDAAVTGKGPIRNLGIASIRGTWFTFLDDDDELLPEALAVLVGAAGQYSYAPHIYRAALLLQDGPHQHRRRAHQFYRSRDPWVQSLFAIGNIAGYLVPAQLGSAVRFRNTRYFQDADYFLRLACEAQIVSLHQPVYVYHRYGNSGSADAYTRRDEATVLSDELSALRQLFDTPHPKIEGYRDAGVYGLAVAARHAWHASAFPSVGLWRTWRRTLTASRAPIVWLWLARVSYLRVERRWTVLARFRTVIGRGPGARPTNA